MLNNKTIAVVIPAFNEESQIKEVLETIPSFIDRVIVINDCSKDDTELIVKQVVEHDKADYSIDSIQPVKIVPDKFNQAEVLLQEISKQEKANLTPSKIINNNYLTNRIILISHLKNAGVGAAVATGYQWCKEHQIDCVVKVDGDGQMDPSEIEKICSPVVYDGIDYVKGNRLIHRSSKLVIPRIRFIGNSVLSILTKIASGYWSVSDTQTAFAAISKNALEAISLDRLYTTYGYPNDILVKLNIASCTLKEVEIKPIYNVGEKSKMKIFKLLIPLSWLLFKSFFKRIWLKYFIRDFHPLFIFYHLAIILGIVNFPFIIELINSYRIDGIQARDSWMQIFIFLSISSLQSLLFAMWMDIQNNERLYKE